VSQLCRRADSAGAELERARPAGLARPERRRGTERIVLLGVSVLGLGNNRSLRLERVGRKFRRMSKAEILAELPRLAAEDRADIIHRLWDLEEMALLRGGEPSAEEKTLLDQALEAYRRDPNAGRPWREVLSGLNKPPAP
jgi:hypothetical protein